MGFRGKKREHAKQAPRGDAPFPARTFVAFIYMMNGGVSRTKGYEISSRNLDEALAAAIRWEQQRHDGVKLTAFVLFDGAYVRDEENHLVLSEYSSDGHNLSPVYYIDGEVLSIDEVEARVSKTVDLMSDEFDRIVWYRHELKRMQKEGWTRIIRDRYGYFWPLDFVEHRDGRVETVSTM